MRDFALAMTANPAATPLSIGAMPVTNDMRSLPQSAQTPAAILRAAWALIEKPENWTQGWFARDADGDSTYEWKANAVCWCAVGALRKAAGYVCDLIELAEKFLIKAAWELFGRSVSKVNDTLGHDAVRRVYARAIEMAEARNG